MLGSDGRSGGAVWERSGVALVAGLVLAGLVVLGGQATADQGETELVSAAAGGGGANGDSYFFPSISADGRFVAFYSEATDIAGDVNGATGDVFRRDMATGTTELVSVSDDGDGADGASLLPSISADGRYVAFQSSATDIPGDVNGATGDVFVRDMVAGTTELVSVSDDGDGADGSSSLPSISADGTRIAFSSSGTDVPGDVNGGTLDVFVRDRAAGTIELVSVSDDGNGADNDSGNGHEISADGSVVAFASLASDIPGDTGAGADVFARDLAAATTELISVAPGGSDGDSEAPSVSADGRFVAFDSGATNIAGDVNGITYDIFVRDRQANTTTLASVSADADGIDTGAGDASVSDDGRYVSFESMATDLPGDLNGATRDVFVHDRDGGTTTLASASADADGADADSSGAVISADGRFVAFVSEATDVPGDQNGPDTDIFRYQHLPDPPPPDPDPADDGDQAVPTIELNRDLYKARSGGRVKPRYETNAAGKVKVLIKAKRKQVRKRFKPIRKTRKHSEARAKRVKIPLKARRKAKPKARKRALPGGRYVLKAILITADGARAKDGARLKIKRRR